MPAKSKSQQRLMGMVHAYKNGKLKKAPKKIKEVAKHISDEDARDFAKTKSSDLPEKKASLYGYLGIIKKADSDHDRLLYQMAKQNSAPENLRFNSDHDRLLYQMAKQNSDPENLRLITAVANGDEEDYFYRPGNHNVHWMDFKDEKPVLRPGYRPLDWRDFLQRRIISEPPRSRQTRAVAQAGPPRPPSFRA